MKKSSLIRVLVSFIVLVLVLPTSLLATVHFIEVDSPIHPVSMWTIQAAIERAELENADALIIQLDTPGGLMESTHHITKSILNSKVPIIVYVAPDGARAGSAGVFITMAAHIAAMAPSTNIGAATPVGMGGIPGTKQDTSATATSDAESMRKKVTNDAIANVRAMAEKHGRNADWAEDAVREAASITAKEALEINVIDLIADDLDDLLAQIDGKIVETVDGEFLLETEGVILERFEMNWRQQFLSVLANPNLAYILMLIGFYGLIFELYNPGAVIPGVIGVIALILAFFAMQTLSLNLAGLLLIVVGIIMLLLEIKVASYGFLTLGGSVSLLIGSIMLFDSPIPALRVSMSVIIPVVAVTILFFAFALTFGIKAQKNKITTGSEGMAGEEGFAVGDIDPTGRVKIGSEYWNVTADGEPIKDGDPIIVTKGDRLTLKVKKVV
jgi:membrane-bound serine protease (ClpP class)